MHFLFFIVSRPLFTVYCTTVRTKICHDCTSNHIVFHDLQRSISQQSSNTHVHTRTNVKVETTAVNPDTARKLFKWRMHFWTVSSLTKRCCRTSTVALIHDSIVQIWLRDEIFKIVFIFVGQESQQKWNPFLLEIGYQLGANKNEIRFVFVCIRRVKASKICKSRSNYPFLFWFLSRIGKGLSEAFQKNMGCPRSGSRHVRSKTILPSPQYSYSYSITKLVLWMITWWSLQNIRPLDCEEADKWLAMCGNFV
jgi:hypothetical protein